MIVCICVTCQENKSIIVSEFVDLPTWRESLLDLRRTWSKGTEKLPSFSNLFGLIWNLETGEKYVRTWQDAAADDKDKKAGPEQAEDLRPFWRQQTEEVQHI